MDGGWHEQVLPADDAEVIASAMHEWWRWSGAASGRDALVAMLPPHLEYPARDALLQEGLVASPDALVASTVSAILVACEPAPRAGFLDWCFQIMVGVARDAVAHHQGRGRCLLQLVHLDDTAARQAQHIHRLSLLDRRCLVGRYVLGYPAKRLAEMCAVNVEEVRSALSDGASLADDVRRIAG